MNLPHPPRLIRVPFQSVPCGERTLLARSGTPEAWPVPRPAARFLESFSTFSTLDERLDVWMQGRRHDTSLADLLKRTATEALRRGFLETQAQWRARHAGPLPGPSAASHTLDAIWIPSGGRAEVCAHTCGTILANLAHHGMTPPLGVVETPSDPCSSAYADALAAEARRHGRRIRHLTLDGTRRFITALANESGVEDRLLRIALTDALAPGLGQAFGAGRNLIQLLQPCGSYLSFDDDVQCRGWWTETSPGWRLDTGPGNADLDLHVTGGDWRLPADPIGPHLDQLGTQWLGCSAQECLACGGLEEAEPVQEKLAARLHGSRGRVRFVYPGTIGDHGNRSKLPLLLHNSAKHHQLLRDPGTLEAALSSRIFRRTYPRRTVGGFHFISGRCTWVDHEDLLPPYFPIGRGEDFFMGRLLPALDPRALAVYLPYAFLHLPVPDRPAFPSVRLHPPNLHHCHWFGHYMVATVPALARDYSHLPVAGALERSGRDLAAWSSWDSADFAAHACSIGRSLISQQIEQTQRLLAVASSIAPAVRDDLEWVISQWQEHLLSPARVFPADLAELQPGSDWSTLQQWFALYGELMAVWPSVRAAAQRLQDRSGDWLEERG